MKDDSLTDHLYRALALIDVAVSEAAAKVSAGPDNPAVHRIRGAGNIIAFTINFSDIGRRKGSASWDPFSHDWLAQYRYAKELIEKRKFSVLRDLLAGGTYRDPSHGIRVFAPEVIEHVKAITGDLRAAVALTDASRMATQEWDTCLDSDSDGNSIIRSEPRQLAGRQLGPSNGGLRRIRRR